MSVAALDLAEESLQSWLRVKPPPPYLERHLIHDDTKDSKEAFRQYTSTFGPENLQYIDFFDGYRIAERESIGVINAISSREHVSRLLEARDVLRDVLEQEGRGFSAGDRARGLDLLGYMTTELFSAQALHIIRNFPMLVMPPDEEFSSAISTCTEACRLALQEGDYFTLSRAAYNLGCLLHDLGTKLNDAIGWLNISFSAGEALFKHAEQTDFAFRDRRLNTLHRLVEIWAKYRQNAFGVETYAPLLKGRFSNFGEASRIRDDGQYRSPIDSRGILPLSVESTTLATTMKMIDASTALVSYLNGERYTSLTLLQAEMALVTLFNPDFEHVGGWDVFFRPTNVEFEASLRQLPDKQKYYAMNVTLEKLLTGVADPRLHEADQNQDDSSDPRLTWSVGRDYLEVTAASKNWGSSLRREYVRFDDSTDWQSKLCELLIEPLIPKLLSSTTHIVISPDGGLNVVPFHLFRLENQLLFDRFSFSYTPTLEMLSKLLSMPSRSKLRPRILVVGDATRTLLGAQREAQDIQELFGSHAIVLGPDDVTIDRIRAEATAVEIIHFCGHARFDSFDLEHSGLLLSGGHWMTIDEIASLQIQLGSTVFLSACQTGRVAIQSNGGLLGLHHAFMAAGSSSVICSFWEVHDVSTAILVRRFYQEYILEKQSRQESLRRAMMLVRSATVSDIRQRMGSEVTLPNEDNAPFADPFFWGAFVLYGDWR